MRDRRRKRSERQGLREGGRERRGERKESKNVYILIFIFYQTKKIQHKANRKCNAGISTRIGVAKDAFQKLSWILENKNKNV